MQMSDYIDEVYYKTDLETDDTETYESPYPDHVTGVDVCGCILFTVSANNKIFAWHAAGFEIGMYESHVSGTDQWMPEKYRYNPSRQPSFEYAMNWMKENCAGDGPVHVVAITSKSGVPHAMIKRMFPNKASTVVHFYSATSNVIAGNETIGNIIVHRAKHNRTDEVNPMVYIEKDGTIDVSKIVFT